MKTLKRITICFAVALTALLLQPGWSQSKLSAAPIQGAACDSGQGIAIQGGPLAGGSIADCGCSDGSCGNGCTGCRSGRGRLGNRLGSRRVRCPDCDHSFPEEYCQVKVEQVEVEKTCFEVDYKTICIPKVVPPWKQRTRRAGCGCGQASCDGNCGGGCDGSCDGACDGSPIAGGCDGNCGGCDGNCGGGRCCSRPGPCKAATCDPNAPNLCCPSSECAEARSVKILKKKKYKCPGCKCKWEVLKPELPEAPVAQPSEAQPSPMAPNTGRANGQPYYQPQPAAPSLNDYYGNAQPQRRQVSSAKPSMVRRVIPATANGASAAQMQHTMPPIVSRQFRSERPLTLNRMMERNGVPRTANSANRINR